MELDELRAEHERRRLQTDVRSGWEKVGPRIARARRRSRVRYVAGASAAALVVASLVVLAGQPDDDGQSVVIATGDAADEAPSDRPAPDVSGERFGWLLDTFGVVEEDQWTRLDVPLATTGATQTLRVDADAAEELSSLDLLQVFTVECDGCGSAPLSVSSPGHGFDLSNPVETLDSGALIVETVLGPTLRWEIDGWLLEVPLFDVPDEELSDFLEVLSFDVVDGWPRLACHERLTYYPDGIEGNPLRIGQALGDGKAHRSLDVDIGRSPCAPGTVRDVGPHPYGQAWYEVCLSGGNAAAVLGDAERVAKVASGLS